MPAPSTMNYRDEHLQEQPSDRFAYLKAATREREGTRLAVINTEQSIHTVVRIRGRDIVRVVDTLEAAVLRVLVTGHSCNVLDLFKAAKHVVPKFHLPAA